MALSFKNIALFTGSVGVIAGGGYGSYYLSKPKTIEQRLITNGEKLIETDNEYLVAFKEHRSNPDFINLIKGDDNSIAEKGDVNKGKVALRTWCENSLKLDLTEENLEKYFNNTQKYCIKPAMTIAERIEKIGKWVTNWEAKLDVLKKPREDKELATDLKGINEDISDLEKLPKKDVYEALEKWCKNNGSKDLAETTTDAIWEKVERRCFELKTDNT